MTDATNGAGRPLVSVVVPVYNEEKTVAQVVDELLELNLRLEILLVDDGSTDGSPAELARLAATHAQVTVLSQPRNRARAPRSAAASTTPTATSCSSRTPTSSTRRRTSRR